MTTEQDALEPCDGCGKLPFVDTTGYDTGAAVECGGAGCYRISAYGGDHAEGLKRAIPMWNAAMRALKEKA